LNRQFETVTLVTPPAITHGLQPLLHWLGAVGHRCPTEDRFQTPEKMQSVISTAPSIDGSFASTEIPLVACSIATPLIVIQARPFVWIAH
jgi:hypothetical protein